MGIFFSILIAVQFILFSGNSIANQVILTAKERAFIAAHPEIKLGVGSSFDPFVIQNMDGSFSGHDIDIAHLISDRTGLQFTFKMGTWADIQAKAIRREVDGLLTAINTKNRALHFNGSYSYVSYTSLVLVKSGNPKNITSPQDIEGKTVALQKGNLLFKDALEQLSSNVKIIYFDTIHELISAVVAGTVDFSILDETAPYLAKKMGLLDFIEVAFPVGEPFNLVFLLRNDWPELTSIVNKGILSIREEDRIEIRDQWFNSTTESIDWSLLGKLITVVAILLGLLLYWSYTLRVSRNKTEAALLQLKAKDKELEAKNEILEVLSITDRLTQLHNREKLDEVLEAEIIRAERYQTRFGVIMLDIDFFKQVNDAHGHQAGDAVLIELSGILKGSSRKTDIVGRWGGEEFLIICPNTENEGLVTLAESLRKKIEEHSFPILEMKTASFGLTMYQPTDTSHSLLSRADHALYLAKDRGRNRVETCYS